MTTDHDNPITAARARDGKPFVTEAPVPRMRPKSAFLRRLERQQRAERATRAPVVSIGRKVTS